MRRELESLRPSLNFAAARPEYIIEAVGSRTWRDTDKWKAYSDWLARQLSDADWGAVESASLGLEEVEFASSRAHDAGASEEVQRETVKGKSAERALRLTDEALKRLR